MNHRIPREEPGSDRRRIVFDGWGLLLKHIYELSDKGTFERLVENPYYRYFTGEAFFRHDMPHERSGLSHWRGRTVFRCVCHTFGWPDGRP